MLATAIGACEAVAEMVVKCEIKSKWDTGKTTWPHMLHAIMHTTIAAHFLVHARRAVANVAFHDSAYMPNELLTSSREDMKGRTVDAGAWSSG